MVARDLSTLAQALGSAAFLERELAATELLAHGRDGQRVLRDVARDMNSPTEVRVTALRHAPADAELVAALHTLLGDPQPVIRVLALEKAGRARATTLRPLLEKLAHDRTSFWDLDEEIVVAEVAARVLADLSRVSP